jgi:hypothetical protein
MGQANQGVGLLPPGQGIMTQPGAWHPTVICLGVLLAVEFIVFGVIARLLDNFHG